MKKGERSKKIVEPSRSRCSVPSVLAVGVPIRQPNVRAATDRVWSKIKNDTPHSRHVYTHAIEFVHIRGWTSISSKKYGGRGVRGGCNGSGILVFRFRSRDVFFLCSRYPVIFCPRRSSGRPFYSLLARCPFYAAFYLLPMVPGVFTAFDPSRNVLPSVLQLVASKSFDTSIATVIVDRPRIFTHLTGNSNLTSAKSHGMHVTRNNV